MASRLCTWARVAVCAISSLLLAGSLGSWYFSWATSSFRNVSESNPLALPTWVVAVFVATGPAPLTGAVIWGSPSREDVHAGRRGQVGGADRAARTGVVTGQRPAARRGGWLAGPALPLLGVGQLLLCRPGPGAAVLAGVGTDLEPVERDARALEVAAQVGQRLGQGVPAVLVRAVQGQVQRPVGDGGLDGDRPEVVGRDD